MIKQKRGHIREMKALFLIANMIIVVFAFSYLVNASDPSKAQIGTSAGSAAGSKSITTVDKVEPISGKELLDNAASAGGDAEDFWSELFLEDETYDLRTTIDETGNIKYKVDTVELSQNEAEELLSSDKLLSNKKTAFNNLALTDKYSKLTLEELYGKNIGDSIGNFKISGKEFSGGEYKITVADSNGDVINTFEGKGGETLGNMAKTGPAAKPGSLLSELLLSEASYGTWLDGAVSGVQTAAMWYGIGQLVGSLAGMEKEQKQALSTALAAGGFTADFFRIGFGDQPGLFVDKGTGVFGTKIGTMGAGIIMAVIVFAIMYKKTSTETVSFECKPWQAPVGGADCEKCNEDGEICNEYRCRSLGQACQLVNVGSEEEKCVWVNPKDVKSPGISPWEDVLTEGYSYTDVRIRPPGEGSEPGRMRIVRDGSSDGCVEAFTPLKFGIVTIGPDNVAEPSQCRIDYNHTLKYDDMAFDFGGKSFYLYNHSQQLALPSPSSINDAAPELQHDGTYTLYVRCRDANGNENVDEFVIRFCVDKGPDVTPPKIEGTSIANEMPVKFNQTNVDLDVYVNEPAECRWSREDRGYDNMEYEMECSKNVWEMNNNMVYTCKTTLTGVSDRQENKFYFRCKDKPNADESERNVNMESYPFVLSGTEPLNIIEIKPNGTIKGSTEVVSVNLEVETANGYKNGEAICYYSDTGKEKDWIEFFDTGTELHKQRLDLTEGSYKYYVKCLDLGGNRDDNSIEFKVEVDRNSPVVVRVYEENKLLKVVTDEDTECKYSIQSCNFKFEDGIDMPYSNQTEHVAEWKTESTYYIRCADSYGNMPLPNSCSIIVRPYDIVEQKVDE